MCCLAGDFNEKQNVMVRKQLKLCGLVHLMVCFFNSWTRVYSTCYADRPLYSCRPQSLS